MPWIYKEDPVCFICGDPTLAGIRLGYESCFDGEWICWKCFRDLLDPVLRKAVEDLTNASK